MNEIVRKRNGNLTLRKLKNHIKQRANVESFKEYFSFVFLLLLFYMLYFFLLVVIMLLLLNSYGVVKLSNESKRKNFMWR